MDDRKGRPAKTSERFHTRLSLFSYNKAFQKPGLSQKEVSQYFPNASDVMMAAELLHSQEKVVYGNAGD